jgi:hypothetical protein
MSAPNIVTSSTQVASDSTPDGFVLGPNTTDLIGFYGKTPVARAAAITLPAATASTSSTPYGYSQSQADAIVTSLRACLTALQANGLLQ